MGFEPTTNGTTNHYSNQLSYSHRFKVMQNYGFLDNLEKYFHIFICSYIHILGWCLKMRLLPHVLFSLGWDWSLICSHVHISGFLPENEVFTAVLNFFGKGCPINEPITKGYENMNIETCPASLTI